MTLIDAQTSIAMVANCSPKSDFIIILGELYILNLDIIGYLYQDGRINNIYQKLLVAWL
jgi:hypothetical protein